MRSTQILCLAQSIAKMIAVTNGLGKAIHLINPLRLTAMEKVNRSTLASPTSHVLSRVTQSDYASDLLYILAIYFSKLSAVFLFLRLTPNKQHIRFCYSILGTSTVWVVAAIFMVAIRCQLGQPWVNDQHCVNIVQDFPAI